MAQARFLRAFLAFDLIKYWGDVPFKTTYTAGYEEAFKGRVSREEIYDQIIVDLNFAKENLQKDNASLSPEVPSQGAAHALLMRVYLQRAGYSLQQDGTLTRPDETKRKEYFNACDCRRIRLPGTKATMVFIQVVLNSYSEVIQKAS